jgi:hypothetical protein
VKSSILNLTSRHAALPSVTEICGNINIGVIAGGIAGGVIVALGGLLAFRLITRRKPQQDEAADRELQSLV